MRYALTAPNTRRIELYERSCRASRGLSFSRFPSLARRQRGLGVRDANAECRNRLAGLRLTHRPFDLGLVGLAQFVPAISLSLVSGQTANR